MPLSETGDVKSDVICTQNDEADADLAAVVAAWPTLPDDVRQAVIAAIQGKQTKSEE